MPRRRAVPTKQESTKPPEPAPATNARPISGWTLPPRPQGMGPHRPQRHRRHAAGARPYPGTIAEVRLTDRVDVLWMTVHYRLDGIEAEPAADMAPIAADPGSAHARRVPDGARLLYRLAAATGADFSRGVKPDDIPALFEGKRVVLKLAHKARDGVPELVVREIRPR